MNPQYTIEIIRKKEKNLVFFSEDGIKIPENLVSIIKGDLSAMTAVSIITLENNFYSIKIGPEIKLKIRKKNKNSKRKSKLYNWIWDW